MTAENRAAWLLFAVPGALLLGALGFQHIGGYVPCEMCLWQRWPHLAAIVLSGLALLAPRFISDFGRSDPPPRALLWPALAAIALSGLIGAFHAGVEQGWWQGPTTCSSTSTAAGDFTSAMIAAPLIRCDSIAWSLFGLSMAAFNAVFSAAVVAVATMLLLRPSYRQVHA